MKKGQQGNQDKTLFKYLIYVYVLLSIRNFQPPFVGVGFRDIELEKKFSIDRQSIISILQALGIITKATTRYSYHNIHISYKYNVNIDTYLSMLGEILERKDVAKLLKSLPNDIGNVNVQTAVFLSRKYINTKWTILTREEQSSQYNKIRNYLYNSILYFMEGNPTYASVSDASLLDNNFSDLEVPEGIQKTTLKQFDKLNLNSFATFRINTSKIWTSEQEEYYTEYYKHLLSQSQLIKSLSAELVHARELGYTVTCNIHITLKKLKSGYKFSTSCRQYNPYCQVEKALRSAEFSHDGFDDDFDLHCAIYAVARLINTGKFDPDWDIKNEILKLNLAQQDGSLLTREDLKILLMRVFFKKSIGSAYSYYRNAVFHHKLTQNISKETLTQLSDECERLVGSMDRYYYNIFAIESILELKVINRLLERKCSVRNIYDCFYFKSNEISNEEVKNIVINEARLLRKEMELA